MFHSSRRLPRPLIFIGLALLAAGLACSILSPAEPTATTAPPVQPPTLPPLPTLAPTSAPSTGGGTATITMVNQSGENICYVNMSPSTDAYWGEDWLGSTEMVGNGESRTFEVEPDIWDMRALTCDQETIEEEWQAEVTSAGYQWIVGPRAQIPQGDATLRLVNNLSVDVCFVQISPSTDQYWGDDWLGSDVISAGTSYDFAVPPGQLYDMRALDCSQEVLADERGIEISETLTTWTLSP